MLGLAIGYFVCYTPFAALTKALSAGLLPGEDEVVGGLVLLPAAAIGVLIGAAVFLAANGWWRYIGVREAFGRALRLPSRPTVVAGFFTALIIATTILNYTFVGVSILFMLLMMRAGTLALAPMVDVARRRRVRTNAWVALALSMIAIAIALGAVDTYTLTLGAVLSLSAYFVGYIGRWEIMSRVAKTGEEHVDRRYFAEEQIAAALWQIALCAAFALIGAGAAGHALREGFTSFLFSSHSLPAIGIGLFYSSLFVFGTLIYLDAREYSWAVPVNRCASVLAVLAASYALTLFADVDPPAGSALVATVFVLMAIAALGYPQIAAAVRGARPPKPGLLLFVCTGNRGRSPIAAAVSRARLRAAGGALFDGWQIASAGVRVSEAGAKMHPGALAAARELGLSLDLHGAQPLTPELCRRASVIYCMTDAQRDAVLEVAPWAVDKTKMLDPAGELPEPEIGSGEEWNRSARRVRELVLARLGELPAVQPA